MKATNRIPSSWIIVTVLLSLFLFVHFIPYWKPKEATQTHGASDIHSSKQEKIESQETTSSPDKTPVIISTSKSTNVVNVNSAHIKPAQSVVVINTESTALPKEIVNPLSTSSQSWTSFASIPLDEAYKRSIDIYPDSFNAKSWMDYNPIVCSAETVKKLATPRLADSEVKFCKWALDPNGGQVVVGKSWGKLKDKATKEKFDSLNCNSVNGGKNPSCDDSWGDKHLLDWKKDMVSLFQCNKDKTSKLFCHRNDNKDLYCTIDNAQIRFDKVRKINRPGNTPSKAFESDFLSADCTDEKHPHKDFPFPHLYSPSLSSQQCDYVYNRTLLLYSHDDIRNVGHTMNDIMNVWVMLWMEGLARYSHHIDMLNIDSFKLGHNFDDEPNRFFEPYLKNLRSIMKGIDFKDKTLCVKRLMIQPIPPRFFIWESWFVDLPCSFVGPSSLYQRYNHHVRHSYGLLKDVATNKKLTVLLVVRNEHSNMWGSQRTSRNYLNLPAIEKGLNDLVKSLGDEYRLIIQDLGKLSFEEQFKLMSETSLVIGMHGAGIATTMHMSVGTKYCCGILELYPTGEFAPIKGHGNMARKMGIHYDRIDIGAKESEPNGAYVPVHTLVEKTKQMLNVIKTQPTCVLPEVLERPFFD